jgi:sugar lactone lactonase YvrE
MNAPVVSRLAPRGSMLLSVALLAMTGLAGAPVAGPPGFPAVIQMFGDTPSGVAVDKPGNVYVSVREPPPGPGLLGRSMIYKYARDGSPSFFANMGSKAVVYGLAVTPNGDLYVAMATGPDHGVYMLDRKGNAELLPGSDGIVFPNGLAFDDRGNLYVTESYSGSPGNYGPGGVWRIAPGGEAKVWVQHVLLTGGGSSPIGANGIGYYHGDLFVTNTNKRTVVRIPVAKDGSAGGPEVWKELGPVAGSLPALSAFPIMPDGLALDVHGNLYMTILTRHAIVRVNADDRTQETVAVLGSPGPAPSAQLDFPASLAFGTGAGEQQNLFVTNLGWTKNYVPSLTWPGAALVKVHAGVPGRPLH